MVDNNNEILFWKVIHNKYIFQQIFNQIHTIDWDKYNDISDYRIDKRMKFKHITSLYWMIKHEQFNLLKCKLENGDHVHIGINGIILLFSKRINYGVEFINGDNNNKVEKDLFIVEQLNEIGYYMIGDEKKIMKRNEIQFANKEILQNSKKQSLELLLKYKRDQLVKMDILNILLDKFNYKGNNYQIDIEMIKFAVNEPYSLPISDKVLKLAIQNTSVQVLEILLNSPTIQISNYFKNNSISWAFDGSDFFHSDSELSNPVNKLEMVQFILNNNQLYNIPSLEKSITSIKRFKNSDGSSTAIKMDKDNGDDNEIVKIKYSIAIKIHSSDLINRLYELNYLQDDIGTFVYDRNHVGPLQFKDIFKHYCSFDSFYSHYLKIYDEMIDGCNNDIVYKHAFENYSTKALQYLLDKDNFKVSHKVGYLPYFWTKTKKQLELVEKELSKIPNDFIKYYLIGYNQFQNRIMDKKIIIYIYSIKSESEYQSVYNSISDVELKSKFSSKWINMDKLELFNKTTNRFPIIIIKDTSTFDLITDNKDYLIKYFKGETKFVHHYKLLFSNFQLAQCEINKDLDYFSKRYRINEIYNYPFTIAIYNCDIDQLKQFKNHKYKCKSGIKFHSFEQIDPITIYGDQPIIGLYKIDNHFGEYKENVLPFNFKNQSISNLIKLIDYLNSTGFKHFEDDLFIEFIKCICATPSIDLSKLKIDFSKMIGATVALFLDSICNKISLDTIQLILNNFNVFNSILKFRDRDFDDFKKYKGPKNHNFLLLRCENGDYINLKYSTLFFRINMDEDYEIYYCTSNDSIQDIQSIIKLLLGHLNKELGNIGNEEIKLIQYLVNILFKRLIKVRNVNIEQVNSTYQLISNEWLLITGESFNFQHTLHHIVYYLGIKSLKLIRFITSHHSVRLQLYNRKIYKYRENEDDVLRYLDPTIYTYEFIFNSSFYIVLERLVQDLVHSIPPQFTSNFEEILNSTLIFYLEIREFDLFFNHLNIINQKLNQHQLDPESNFDFLYKLVNNACIVLDDDQFKQFAEFNSYKSIKNSILSHKNDKLLSKHHHQFILSIISDQYNIKNYNFE